MKIRTSILFSALVVLFCTNAWGAYQATSPSIYGFDFRFNTPGARSNAMGGAFIGLADDATAAYTNPAGLTILTKPEVSLEYKYGEYTTTMTDADTSGPTVITQTIEYDDSVQSPSFISYVYPKEKSTIAVYRHQLVDIKSNFRYGTLRTSGELFDVNVDLDAETLGLGFGLKLAEKFSVGIATGFTEMTYWENTTKTDVSTDDLENTEIVNGTDKDIHYTVSLLWSPFEAFSLGLVYRQGPEFSFRKIAYEPKWLSVDTDGDLIPDQVIKRDIIEFNLNHDIKIPDAFALGFSYRISPGITALLDVNYIEYSDIMEGMTDQGGTIYEEQFTIEDTYEVHFGLEYVMDLNDSPLALRCGYYYRPSHLFYFNGDYGSPAANSLFQTIFPEGEDDHIYSIGFGTLISENVQIDLAGSFGDFATEITTSLVYRFE